MCHLGGFFLFKPQEMGKQMGGKLHNLKEFKVLLKCFSKMVHCYPGFRLNSCCYKCVVNPTE